MTVLSILADWFDDTDNIGLVVLIAAVLAVLVAAKVSRWPRNSALGFRQSSEADYPHPGKRASRLRTAFLLFVGRALRVRKRISVDRRKEQFASHILTSNGSSGMQGVLLMRKLGGRGKCGF